MCDLSESAKVYRVNGMFTFVFVWKLFESIRCILDWVSSVSEDNYGYIESVFIEDENTIVMVQIICGKGLISRIEVKLVIRVFEVIVFIIYRCM